MIQSCFWKSLKTFIPGFVQGYTKDGLIKLFQDGLGDEWDSVCLDGSSFDAAQNADVMKAVDDQFWVMITPAIRSLL